MDALIVPNIVKALAQQVGMTPIAWVEHPDTVVIVFEQGPKITFAREQVTPTVQEIKAADTGADTQADTHKRAKAKGKAK